MYSSNQEFNTLVTEKSNIGNVKIGEFEFGPADLAETLDFINTFRAVYFDVDEPYKLNAATEFKEEPKDKKEEKPTEDDGFGTDEEDDDGF